MIVEIHYKGKVVGELDLPEVTEVKELQLSARVQSSMGKTAGEAYYREHIPTIHRTPKLDFRPIPHNKKYFDETPGYHVRHYDFQKSYVKKKEEDGPQDVPRHLKSHKWPV